MLHMRLVLTEATFDMRRSCRKYIVAYVGSLLIGGIVGF